MSPEYSEGPLAVGLLALHDRKFFEDLLENPSEALEAVVDSGKLTLTREDKDHVIRLIQAARDTGKPTREWLDKWDGYRKNGIWGGGWPMGWVERTPRRP